MQLLMQIPVWFFKTYMKGLLLDEEGEENNITKKTKLKSAS